MISIGTQAPDFTLDNHNGEQVKLSDYKGKKVLISWHPLAYTGICAIQMQDLFKLKDDLAALNVVGIGISVDTQFAKHAWAKELGVLPQTMLSDFWPHGKTAQDYDVFQEEAGISGRANMLIDEQGKVVWAKLYENSTQPDFSEVMQAIKSL